MTIVPPVARRLALEPVAPGVWLLRGGFTREMNVYLLEDDGGVVVFDTGEKGMAPAIAAAAERMGGLRRVVLGHADTDHRGSAPALSRLAPVVCHPDAVAEAQGSGGRSYWQPGRLPVAIRGFHGILHRFVWDGGPVRISDTVREGDTVAGFTVIDLAGHAPGQIGLWRERDRVALVSDTVYLTSMTGRPSAAHVPQEAYNLDTARARASIRRLAALDPRIVGVGHRGPMEGPGVRAELERAAAT
jgi:glyoxylase-like metal-dependent hydrolase (beta-lactamase superfamily II)